MYLRHYASTVAYDRRSSHDHAVSSSASIAGSHRRTTVGLKNDDARVAAEGHAIVPHGGGAVAGFHAVSPVPSAGRQILDDRVAVTQPLRQLVHLATNTVTDTLTSNGYVQVQHHSYVGAHEALGYGWGQDVTHGVTHHTSHTPSWLPAPPSPGPWLD
jgi:hypothetical protein